MPLITIDEARYQLRATELDITDSETQALIDVAEREIQERLGRSLEASETTELTRITSGSVSLSAGDSLVLQDVARLPDPIPLTGGLAEVKFIDAAGQDLKVLDSSSYYLTQDPNSYTVLTLIEDVSVQTDGDIIGLQVKYNTGFDTLPAQIKQAMLFAVGIIHDNRTGFSQRALTRTPINIATLLVGFRVI